MGIIFTQFIHSQSLTYRPGEVIVLYKGSNPPVVWQALTSRNAKFSTVPVLHRVKSLGSCWNIWLYRYDASRLTFEQIRQLLAEDSNVIGFQRNKLLTMRKEPNDPFFALQWYHKNDGSTGGMVNADFDSDLAWNLTTGGVTESGDTIVICVIDEGLEIEHEDIFPNLWFNRAEIPGNGVDDDQNGYTDDYRGWNTFKNSDVFDPGKHGTAVCGLAAAKGNNGKGISGMAWDTRLMFVQGGGDEANAIESYAYPLLFRRLYNQTKGKKGAFVVATNSSWGADLGKPEDSPLWCAIYDSLGKEGILNVASTTNQNIDVDVEGDLPTTCPSDYLITTTNITDLNLKKSAAGYGNKSIDLGAYGESTYSTYVNNSYRFFGGTSAAAPQVTGAIGLLYSLPCSALDQLALSFPSAAAKEAKRLLMESVKPNASLKEITVSGGVLNSFDALMRVFPFKISKPDIQTLSLTGIETELQFPFNVRYRKLGDSSWIVKLFTNGNQFDLTGLETCTEYELQFKNACPRWSQLYSPTRIFRTGGCCDPIENIQVLHNAGETVVFQYQDAAQGTRLTALIRKEGEIKWDSILFPNNNSLFTLSYLDPCTRYELFLFSYCNGKPSYPSQSYFFTTSGCFSCSDQDYCRRYRPSSELEWLHSLSLNQISFISGNNQGYGNFVGTNHQWTLEKSKHYTIQLNAGYLSDTSSMVAGAWIDYNQDGQFDDAENFALPAIKFTGSIQFDFQIPLSVPSGWTRMRIAIKFAEFSSTAPLACFQSLEFGEYEDYCVLITDAICPPVQDFIFSNLQNDKVQVLASPYPSNQYEYAFRKLYEPYWVVGSSNSRLIQLSGLDSCTRYEFKLKGVCNRMTSQSLNKYFTTTGTGCIVQNETVQRPILSVYPNPARDYLMIKFVDLPLSLKYRCISAQGLHFSLNPLVQSLNKQQLISIDHLPSGYYILQCFAESGITYNYSFIKL